MNIEEAAKLIKKRPADAHKGVFGKALLCVGSYGMMGAAVLSARACLRSGVGLCYVCAPERCLDIVQISVPEAVFRFELDDLAVYDAIGVGSGLGRGADAVNKVDYILGKATSGLVIDADAINIIAEKQWQGRIPKGAVLTPHAVEFSRLTGCSGNRGEQIKAAQKFAVEHGVVVVLKGAGTAVVNADGAVDINTTGNSGMATAGSGDVLTGIITGLLAQGYSPFDAARLGVFLHGLAGDIAAAEVSEYSLIASDIVNRIGFSYDRILFHTSDSTSL